VRRIERGAVEVEGEVRCLGAAAQAAFPVGIEADAFPPGTGRGTTRSVVEG
jgi:hypothetical protein